VCRAFAELLANEGRSTDLLVAVERGVQSAFLNLMDQTGGHPFTRLAILTSIEEGTRQAIETTQQGAE